MTLVRLFRGIRIRTSAFLAVGWGCSLSPRAAKGGESQRPRAALRWVWGMGAALGGSRNLTPICGGRRARVEG